MMPRAAQKRTLMSEDKGHPGIVKTKQRLHTNVWWPNIDKEVELPVKSCPACQVNGTLPTQVPAVRTMLPAEPWQILAIDMWGSFPTGEHPSRNGLLLKMG